MPSRIEAGATVHLSAQAVADMFVVFVADLVEQINTGARPTPWPFDPRPLSGARPADILWEALFA